MRTLTIPRVPSAAPLRLPAARAMVAAAFRATPARAARALVVPLLAAAMAAAPIPVASQSVTLGATAGLSRSRQILERESDSDPRDGFVAGAWMDVQTPQPLLHVLAEAGYAQRGGRFPLAGPGGLTGLTGTVESDWITFTTVPVLHVAAGPAAAFVYGGPMLELHVRTRSAAALRNAYATPSDQGFSAIAGVGLEAHTAGWVVRGEARVVEGLSAAYSGSAGDIRHRSYEVLVRLGKRHQAAPTPAP